MTCAPKSVSVLLAGQGVILIRMKKLVHKLTETVTCEYKWWGEGKLWERLWHGCTNVVLIKLLLFFHKNIVCILLWINLIVLSTLTLRFNTWLLCIFILLFISNKNLNDEFIGRRLKLILVVEINENVSLNTSKIKMSNLLKTIEEEMVLTKTNDLKCRIWWNDTLKSLEVPAEMLKSSYYNSLAIFLLLYIYYL
jgi:hypothetical protein